MPLLPTPAGGDVWGGPLNAAIRGLMLTPGTHTSRDALTDIETGSLFPCTTHNAIERKTASGWDTWIDIDSANPSNSPHVLAETVYAPSAFTQFDISSATITDISAADLSVTFTAPASGKVDIVLSGLVGHSNSGNASGWCLREGTTTLANTQSQVLYNVYGSVRVTNRVRIEGLTPGSSHTYKWAHYRHLGSGTASLYVGGDAAGTSAAGPASMIVTDPEGSGGSASTSDTWHNVGASGEPAFQNSWQNYNTANSTTAYRNLAFKRSADGTKVELRGLTTHGTASSTMSSGTIFVLPAGYRPDKFVTLAVPNLSPTATIPTYVSIQPTGEVWAVQANVTVGSSLSWTGLTFELNE